MTTYSTGNGVGSVDVRDLYDNAENLDYFSAGTADDYPDRLGVSRRSVKGMNTDFFNSQITKQIDFNIAQAVREAEFDAFMDASSYQDLGAYAAGLVFTNRAQMFSYSGVYYVPGPTITLPYTTTGTGAAEVATFRSVGDGVLRTEVNARKDKLIYITDPVFGGSALAADGVTDWQAVFEAAAASSYQTIYVPPGKYLLSTGNLNITGKKLWGMSPKSASTPYGSIGAQILTTQTTNPVFIIGKGSALQGLSFFYPDQDGSGITDVSGYPTIVGGPIVYPPTIKSVTTGCSGFVLTDLVFINAYHCIELGDPAFVGACGRGIIDKIDAFALKHFMTVYNGLGEIVVSNFDISPISYQDVANIGDMKLYKWRQQNADDFVLKRADGFTACMGITLGAARCIHVPSGYNLSLARFSNILFDQARTVLDAEYVCSNVMFTGCQIYGSTLFSAVENPSDLFRFRSTSSASSFGSIILSDIQVQTALRSLVSLETANCVSRIVLRNIDISTWGRASGLSGEIAAVYAASAAIGTAIKIEGGNYAASGYASSVGVSHNAGTGSALKIHGASFSGCLKSIKAAGTTIQDISNCDSLSSTGTSDLDLTGGTLVRERNNRWNKPPVSKVDNSPWFVARQSASSPAISTGTTILFGAKLRDGDVSMAAGTGIHTVKEAGAYAYSVTLSHAGGTAGDVFVVQLVTALGSYTRRVTMLSTTQSVSFSETVEMRVGDTAYVRVARVSGSGTWTTTGAGDENYFTGRLIN